MGDGVTNQDYLLAWLLATKTGRLPKALEPGETLRGAIVASHPARLCRGFVLQLLSNPSVVSAAFKWAEKRPPNQGRLAVQVGAIYGAVQLETRVEPTHTDFTSITGIGARAVYGFSDNFSVVGTLAVLSTGEAEFEGGTTIEATIVRAFVGDGIQFGETYVPYVPVGIGGRISDYDSEDDSNSGIRVDDLFAVVGGVDAWLSDSLVIGLSLGYLGGENISLEAGLHLGFAWKP